MSAASLDEFQQRLGHPFRDAELLRLALTHPSIAHEQSRDVLHNQRLEFLGDAVLQLALTRELYDRYPALDEGPLTKARAHMVNRRALAEQARRLGLGEHLILSRGEETTGGRARPSNLADAFEALMGAVFLDGGFDAARTVVLRLFDGGFGTAGQLMGVENPKGELQELLQARNTEAPQYRLESSTGPDHNRDFECTVLQRGVEIGRGRGKSKKDAETEAARVALEFLRARAAEAKPATD
ncbi:MAG: ribonuclease III [Verrucomicrobia bacterium]|nr:ribonuclease III [Verrucomicrobiota bacterium]